jgi:sarcosine oxidase, subunit beta
LQDLSSTRSTACVVGAGITGLAIAYELASRGLDVAILERTGIGAGASGVQPGGVRQQWGTRVNCALARESLEFYRRVEEHLDAPHIGPLTECGYVFLAHSDERLAGLSEEVALQHEMGVPSVLLDPAELGELVPGLDVTTVFGASYCAEDGYFDRPQAVVEAYAAAARRRGVRIEQRDVVALRQGASGWTLHGANGERDEAEVVVLATAFDTPRLVAPLNITLPIAKEPRYLFYSEPIRERLLEPLVISAERAFAAKHLANGRVLASHLAADGDPGGRSNEWRRAIKQNVSDLLPVLEYVEYSVLVEGFYDVTPDNQPVLGPVPGHDGLWLAAGFSGHGFMLAPAVSRAVANLLVDRTSDPLFEDFALDRFERAQLTPELQVV